MIIKSTFILPSYSEKINNGITILDHSIMKKKNCKESSEFHIYIYICVCIVVRGICAYLLYPMCDRYGYVTIFVRLRVVVKYVSQ